MSVIKNIKLIISGATLVAIGVSGCDNKDTQPRQGLPESAIEVVNNIQSKNFTTETLEAEVYFGFTGLELRFKIPDDLKEIESKINNKQWLSELTGREACSFSEAYSNHEIAFSDNYENGKQGIFSNCQGFNYSVYYACRNGLDCKINSFSISPKLPP